MRQVAYPVFLGGFAIAAKMPAARGAEWSVAPTFSTSVDYDSNRRLEYEPHSSEAGVLAIDLKFKRSIEDLQLTFEPSYTLRRYTDRTLGNGDDRSVLASLLRTGEKTSLNLSASYLDQSTLYSELLETGVTVADTHRRTAQAGVSWTWAQTERRSLVAQAGIMHVSYYGRFGDFFPGFRYPSGSLGEQFAFTERGTFTVSAFGSRLQSDTPANSSHEAGLQAEIAYQWSETTKLDASLGESRRQLTGKNSNGTDAQLSLEHSFYVGKLAASYKRSLVPYGFGYLVEQQQFQVNYSLPLTEYLDLSFSAFRIQNSESTILQLLDRRNYNTLSAGLDWRPQETWSFGLLIQGARTQTIALDPRPVREWRANLNATWAPRQVSRSW